MFSWFWSLWYPEEEEKNEAVRSLPSNLDCLLTEARQALRPVSPTPPREQSLQVMIKQINLKPVVRQTKNKYEPRHPVLKELLDKTDKVG